MRPSGWIASLALAFTACAYHNSAMVCAGEAPCPIAGLRETLDGGKNIQVLVVHGIGHHDPGYSDRLLDRVAARLHMTKTAAPVPTPLPDPSNKGVVRTATFRDSTGRSIRTYEVTWSGIVDPWKERVLGYDAKNAAAEERSIVNGTLKRSLMNERLADPVLYLGEQQNAIRYPVRFALCTMMHGTLEGDRCKTTPTGGNEADEEIVMITESLGSRITFDTILAMRQEEGVDVSATDRFAQRISRVFMLANQLPLLELADVTANGEESGGTGGLGALLNLRRVQEAGVPAMHVIAFSDPNDLLSYEIDPAFADEFPEDRFTNIRIGVSGLGLFRIVANPLKAHVNYENDDRVVDIIASGRSK